MDKTCTLNQSPRSVVRPDDTYSEDEIHPELRFTGAGILAMANSGPNTNGKFFSVVPKLSFID
jgi:cyclophilin family peptidyl-prolyl cis-trans isomerase